MRKTYMMLMTLLLTIVGVQSASAVQADLDPAMFKAWDSPLPGANVVADPEPEPKNNGPFGCTYALYENLGLGATIYGSPNVYYLWYADITGTKTMTVTGTPGMNIRLMLNREPAVQPDAEGNYSVGDADGAGYVEIIQPIGDDGTVVFDLSSYEYLHLNAIKIPWSGQGGTVRSIVLDGTVKPVTGWIPMIENGDFEGDDLESFPVSKNGPNNGNTANDRPTIVEGAGVNGSRAALVASDDNATETWNTQFFLKMNKYLPEGTQWRLSIDIRADRAATISTSAQGEPRAWHDGFITNFDVNDEWKTYTFEGTITSGQAGSDGLGSVAFDLNNDKDVSNNFYFDNIAFEIYEEQSPISLISANYCYDVVRVNFGKATNIADLVKACGQPQLVFPNELATVTVDGQPTTIMSVEGRADGYLWIFIDEGYSSSDEAEYIVSFTNPTDAEHQIIYTAGKYEGEPVPSFSNILATFEDGDGIGDAFSYLYGAPALVSADPEDGSFNLPTTMKDFKLVFDHKVNCEGLVAKLGTEKLTVTPATGFAEAITLTRTGSGELKGEYALTVTNIEGEHAGLGDVGELKLRLSFGPVVIDPNDQPATLISPDNFANCANDEIPVGFVVNYGPDGNNGNPWRVPGVGYGGGGARMFEFAQGGDATKWLYFREGYTQYGTTEAEREEIAAAHSEAIPSLEEHLLTLEAGKHYNIHFNSAMWKGSNSLTFSILNDDDIEEYNQVVECKPDMNGQKSAVVGSTSTDVTFVPTATGNYRLRWANAGFVELLLSNVKLDYVPATMGAQELAKLQAALDNAKAVRDGNTGERYAGQAFNALSELIATVEATTFTAPSKIDQAVADLEAAALTMTKHHELCDTYDPLPGKANELAEQFAGSKFENTTYYADIVAAAQKYADKELTDDAELTAAIAELQQAIKMVNGMFTTGASRASTTGYAALGERIRIGVETLKALGVAEDDELLIAADNTLGDSESMAFALKQRTKKELYEQLKNGAELFKPETDPETGEVLSTPELNMSLFIKNPNFYMTTLTTNDFSEQNIPGWTFEASGNAYLDASWGGVGQVAPVDITLCNWNGSFYGTQVIEDLPAGVYTLKSGFQERTSDATSLVADSYLFACNSAAELPGDTVHVNVFGSQDWNLTDRLVLPNIVVADGKLTIGMNADAASHLFINQVSLWMTAPATGVDYAALYEEVLAGIDETVAKEAQIRAIEIYDLNGRRVNTAKNGIAIVKKIMSDGTIRVEKMLVK